jgi:hypothetical protein
MHQALIKLVDLARRCGVRLRQGYRRVAKNALIWIGRYQHAIWSGAPIASCGFYAPGLGG